MSKKKLTLLVAFIIIVLVGGIYSNFLQKREKIPQIKVGEIQETSEKTDAPRLSVVASNLEIPWALAFLPDRSILFTERPGRVRLIDNKNNLTPEPIVVINETLHAGEGGLMGIAIHPNFS